MTYVANDMGSLSSSPATPSSVEEYQHEKVYDKKKRQLLNQRKLVISNLFQKCGYFPSPKDLDEFLSEHISLFGSENFLKVKIREHRQKHMQNNPSPQSQ